MDEPYRAPGEREEQEPIEPEVKTDVFDPLISQLRDEGYNEVASELDGFVHGGSDVLLRPERHGSVEDALREIARTVPNPSPELRRRLDACLAHMGAEPSEVLTAGRLVKWMAPALLAAVVVVGGVILALVAFSRC